jgi:hypothetical protein
MPSGDNDLSRQSETDVLERCDAYRALTETRISLDRRLMALGENDGARDVLWQELEDVMARLSGLAMELAATPATQPAALRAKAGILALMLRAGGSGAEAFNEDAAALALSVADEVAGQVG